MGVMFFGLFFGGGGLLGLVVVWFCGVDCVDIIFGNEKVKCIFFC